MNSHVTDSILAMWLNNTKKFCWAFISSMKMGAGQAARSWGRNWNYIHARTVKPHDFLKLKNVLVKSAYCTSNCTKCSIIIFWALLKCTAAVLCAEVVESWCKVSVVAVYVPQSPSEHWDSSFKRATATFSFCSFMSSRLRNSIKARSRVQNSAVCVSCANRIVGWIFRIISRLINSKSQW